MGCGKGFLLRGAAVLKVVSVSNLHQQRGSQPASWIDLVDVEWLLAIGQSPDDPPPQGLSHSVLSRQAGVDIEGARHSEWDCIHLPVHQHPCLHLTANKASAVCVTVQEQTSLHWQ